MNDFFFYEQGLPHYLQDGRRSVTPVKSEPRTCYSNHPSEGYATLEYSSDEGEGAQSSSGKASVCFGVV